MADIDVNAYIDQLRRSLPYVPPFLNHQIKALHRKREFGGIIRLVRSMMNVDARITLHWTNNPPSNREAKAWIRLPNDMPKYGTQAFKDLKLDMFILKSFAHQSRCHEFIVVVAHEFSHVVLESIGHPLRTDEKAVDLTAMLLGFSYSYRLAAHAAAKAPNNKLPPTRLGNISPTRYVFWRLAVRRAKTLERWVFKTQWRRWMRYAALARSQCRKYGEGKGVRGLPSETNNITPQACGLYALGGQCSVKNFISCLP
jgi:hypothetical protein